MELEVPPITTHTLLGMNVETKKKRKKRWYIIGGHLECSRYEVGEYSVLDNTFNLLRCFCTFTDMVGYDRFLALRSMGNKKEQNKLRLNELEWTQT